MGRYIDKDDIEEEWRDIDIYPQYQISNIGNVVRKKDGVLLKQYPQKSGYVYVVLDRGEGRHYVPIHRLVCIAFHGMDGYVKGLYVDHINTIRSDNRACNLRWVTAKENANNETTKLNRKRKRKVMKTNKAPEKIYLFENPISNECDDRWLLNRSCDNDIEYIRTDAFIEKAADWLNNFYNEETHSYLIYEDIEKFQNYMKRE